MPDPEKRDNDVSHPAPVSQVKVKTVLGGCLLKLRHSFHQRRRPCSEHLS